MWRHLIGARICEGWYSHAFVPLLLPREREKDSVGQGRALSHSAPMRGLQGCTDLTLQAADQ